MKSCFKAIASDSCFAELKPVLPNSVKTQYIRFAFYF